MQTSRVARVPGPTANPGPSYQPETPANVGLVTSASPVAVVQAHLQAFSSGDLPAVLATMAPDAEFVTGTTFVDPEEFADFFGWTMRELDPSVQIATVVLDDRTVACQFVESVTLDGERRHLNRAAFYRVDNGVITSAKVYDERVDLS
jgi:ketosteroid isomerase-like protein